MNTSTLCPVCGAPDFICTCAQAPTASDQSQYLDLTKLKRMPTRDRLAELYQKSLEEEKLRPVTVEEIKDLLERLNAKGMI